MSQLLRGLKKSNSDIKFFGSNSLTRYNNFVQKVKIKINKYDIFAYAVGQTTFEPIEKCIDPMRYEVFDTFIYDTKEKKNIDQSEDFCRFSKQVSKLKTNARKMQPSEIDQLCQELEEIAPKCISI